jgi:hypothetical protein
MNEHYTKAIEGLKGSRYQYVKCVNVPKDKVLSGLLTGVR